MSATPSESIRLFGTDEAVTPPRVLRAGPLSAELDAGNLRWIRFHGREVIRAISFIVRDRNWGTYDPRITDLVVEEAGDRFTVTYRAETSDAEQRFAYSGRITGDASGSLVFEGKGEALSDFTTNRTGFVVLHPVDGVAGAPVTIEHVDGSVVEGRFPELIDPVQPMMDLRALTHEAAPGLKVTCRMEGDTFEMEDQRNWTDASYKTYVRPLALPWPYTLAEGETLDQRVTLRIEGAADPGAAADGGAVALCVGEVIGPMPPLGIGLEPAHHAATLEAAETLREAGPHHVVCCYDPRQGDDAKTLEDAVAVARALGAEPWLEAVVAEVEGFEAEIRDLGRAVDGLGQPFAVVLLSPAPDLKCTLPGSPWPPCPPLEAVYAAGRKAFPKARIGGGMFSYFTELNRKRPPLAGLDLVSFTTSSLVHAGDDRSATESLEALPYVAASVRAIVEGKPWHVGPSALAMRHNPYGAAPMENPNNARQAMNRLDPRQRGLLGAAWNLGYVAHFAKGGATAVSLGGGVGEFGLVHAPMAWSQPWFDEAGGLYPVFHVVRGLARLAGGRLREVASDRPRAVQALAVDADGSRELWLANLTGDAVSVALPAAFHGARAALLDAEGFVEAARDPAFMDRLGAAAGASASIAPYAVLRLATR